MSVECKCDVCYRSANKGFYFLLTRTVSIVFLKSQQVSHIEGQTVFSKSGRHIECDVIQGGLGYVLYEEGYPHLFCSTDCSQKISNSGSEINHILQREFENGAFSIDCRDDKTKCWDVFVFDSANIPKINCSSCNALFPLLTPKYTTYPIIKTKTMPAVYGKLPKPFGYETGHASVTANKPHGNGWFFKLKGRGSKENQFCCDTCAADYAEENNVFVMYPSLILRTVAGITPYIRQYNREIGNTDACMRPYKLMPIP